ncbi:hypothetical protein LTR70_001665 [Exophiala xenobiotica]|uniref:Peptidase A1 domain-containing protein n=1 Tax=Lithohypha guttulata TaxID=1690604 RepID=A0ABR0KHE3_9EURO|nr:hypothetical protein LTR24_002557 [Lithohypha guttulata]KAK5327190.1 hypothetical protein LTR70_001665 [Exophiala xenobiotica]
MLRLLLPVLLYQVAGAAECTGNVFALPIKDVLVDSSIENSYVIGIPASVGTPEQDVVLLPWASVLGTPHTEDDSKADNAHSELNNTYLYDENAYCDDTVIWSDTMCRIRRGSLYLESDSTSWQQQTDLVDAGGATQETLNPGAEAGVKDLVSTSLGGTDNIRFASTGILNGFPIGIPRLQWDNGYSILHPLGMGPNSSYLNTLLDAGSIGARVWSLYWGRMWTDDNPLDGSMVLGGYDERLTMGPNYTAPLDYSGICSTGLKTNVIDITLNFRGGKDVKLLEDETPACIVPTRQNLLGLEASYQTLFQNLTETDTVGDSFGVHWGSMLFDADNAYDGDITISLATGLSVRIPNDQFVPPAVEYDRNGSRIFNESRKAVLMERLGVNTVTLGRYFLTASYLMVDYEEDTFTMWNANPTTASSLKPVVRKDATNICSNSTLGTGANNTPTQEDPDSPSPPRKLSTGAMAGIIVGAVALALVTALAALFLWRKKRQQANVPPPVLPPKEKHGGQYELQVQESLASQPPSGWGSVWSSRSGDSKTALHQSYVQPQTAELDAAQAQPPHSDMHGSHKPVYEMEGPGHFTPTPRSKRS